MLISLRKLALLSCVCFSSAFLLAQSDSTPPAQAKTESIPTFRTTVRRVVVDVVVRDSANRPVHGLKASDFIVAENGQPQNILSFDVFDLEKPSISLPPNAPHMPPNHFVNIPPTPEHGPLYVILYDLANIESEDQLDARRQVMKFIKSMPDGTRFAIFVRSDGLYLVQGFTADKALLYATLDPQNPKPHVPKVFMMGKNLGYNDPASMINVLTQVNEFLEGVPGHKNLIWLAGVFPLALVPRKEDPREYEDQLISEINVLTRAQVAVYPINVGGVPVNPPGMLTGARVHGGNNNQNVQAGGPIQGSGGPGINSLQVPDATGLLASIQAQSSGDSMYTDYDVQRALAEATGGHAFYSTNDVTAALAEATDIGGNYYSLSYSPANFKDDGGRRSVAVRAVQPGYKLSYRRFYFTSALKPKDDPAKAQRADDSAAPPAPAEYDALQPNMKHGAPMVHDLLFSAHIHVDGIPAKASPEQMAQLAQQPAYITTGHKDKALAPVDLQKYVVDYRVTDLSLKAAQNGKVPSFEFAAAAFDSESRMLNGIVNDATGDTSVTSEANKTGVFRVRQQLDIPVQATWIRIGVRDKLTNRMGTLEIQLPLAPEAPSPAVTSAR
ncbi:MAG: VWA domain-containing protein [Candidatus Sulfotelmatobacter sp.]